MSDTIRRLRRALAQRIAPPFEYNATYCVAYFNPPGKTIELEKIRCALIDLGYSDVTVKVHRRREFGPAQRIEMKS